MDPVGLIAKFPGMAPALVPQHCYVFFDDFLGARWSATADAEIWNETLVAQAATGLTILDGTDTAEDEAGGVLSLVTEATADDGENLQVNGEAFHLEDGYPLYFEARLNLQDVSNTDMFIGLAVTDPELVKGGATDTMGFRLVEGVLSALAEKGSNEKTVACSITETDDQWIRVAFSYDGDDTVTFYIDDDDDGDFQEVTSLKKSTTAHYLPDTMMMTPTIEAIVGTTASAQTVYVDYVLCAQQRFRSAT